MTSFWKLQEVQKVKMKVYYWAKRLSEGRKDALAIDRYNRYVAEMDALKKKHNYKPKDGQKEEVIAPVFVPEFTVGFQ